MTQTPSYYDYSVSGSQTLYWPTQNGGSIVAQATGSVNEGDIIAFYVYNPAFAGGVEWVSYTAQPGDDIVALIGGLASAINSDSVLSSVGITASNTTQANLPWSEELVAEVPTAAYSQNNITATDGDSNTTQKDLWQLIQGPSSSPSFSYDSNGNMTSDGTNSYTWDAENRLIQITYPGSGNYSAFTYNAFGQNVLIQEYAGATLNNTKQFIWSGNIRREIRDESGTAITKYFDRGESVSGTNYYFTKDHLGSVREMSDSMGSVKAQYSYTPYGQSEKLSGAEESDVQFTGYYEHKPSGLYLAKARAYNSDLSRFLSRDPVPTAGDINGYAYVENDPTGLVDPDGTQIQAFLGPAESGVAWLIGALGAGALAIHAAGANSSDIWKALKDAANALKDQLFPCCKKVLLAELAAAESQYFFDIDIMKVDPTIASANRLLAELKAWDRYYKCVGKIKEQNEIEKEIYEVQDEQY
jgi:RHS repeat-associated protein